TPDNSSAPRLPLYESQQTLRVPPAQAKPVLFPGNTCPAIRASSTDLEQVPLWEGKPVTELDIDADLAEAIKP
ncbi:hypothetical protein H2198_009515, partial [Neophaeococcomyces mojaviensis]